MVTVSTGRRSMASAAPSIGLSISFDQSRLNLLRCLGCISYLKGCLLSTPQLEVKVGGESVLDVPSAGGELQLVLSRNVIGIGKSKYS